MLYPFRSALESRCDYCRWFRHYRRNQLCGAYQYGIDYGFYPLSKANYEFYNAIEKQIRTDGGIYNQSASTPESNFTGGTIYGQFIVTSESVINSKKAVNRSDLLEIIHANN